MLHDVMLKSEAIFITRTFKVYLSPELVRYRRDCEPSTRVTIPYTLRSSLSPLVCIGDRVEHIPTAFLVDLFYRYERDTIRLPF